MKRSSKGHGVTWGSGVPVRRAVDIIPGQYQPRTHIKILAYLSRKGRPLESLGPKIGFVVGTLGSKLARGSAPPTLDAKEGTQFR